MKHAGGEWILSEPDEKLTFRATLPGAFGFDQAAHLLRALQADGVAAIDLLPVALPTTWMVNAKATSKTFRAWLLPPARGLWEALLAQLHVGVDEWATLGDERDTIASLVARLSQGAGLAAVSKVLGLLRPQLVPLMDDAAVAFAIGAVPMPVEESATAGPEVFLPMIDWFAAQVQAGESELIEIAKRHPLAVLDAPQVLDRMLWMDAWGERYRRPKRDAGS
jgi:hypothetical protein